MKRMWSEEEVNAAIAEYAATHPAGGKIYVHEIFGGEYDDLHIVVPSSDATPISQTNFGEKLEGKIIFFLGSLMTYWEEAVFAFFGFVKNGTVAGIGENSSDSPTAIGGSLTDLFDKFAITSDTVSEL